MEPKTKQTVTVSAAVAAVMVLVSFAVQQCATSDTAPEVGAAGTGGGPLGAAGTLSDDDGGVK